MQMDENNDVCNFTNKKLDKQDKDFLPNVILKLIDIVIKNEGYIDYKINKRTISTEGGNYLGILIEVDVIGKTKDGDKETNIFVKQIIPSEQLKLISVSECYSKESFFYNEIVTVYEELQDKAGVPESERFKAVKTFKVSNTEAIVMENLSRKGFETLHRMDTISLKYAKLCVKQLAKFHGLSMVLRDQKPEYFEKKLKSLKFPFDTQSDILTSFIHKMCDITSAELNDDAKKRMMKFKEVIMERYAKHWETTASSCVCHGDYRPNNIMHREEEGETQEVIPVDFQLLHYGNPINDFIYFIFVGTDKDFRKNNLENLKNFYYETLKQFLEYFDMDLNNTLPREDFERQYKFSLEYGLILSTYVIPFNFTLETDVPDLGRTDVKDAEFKLDGRYKERIQGIVDDFIQWGYI